MGSFSIWHWLIVLAIVTLVFGTKKLRNLGGDLGGAIKSFQASMKEGQVQGATQAAVLIDSQSEGKQSTEDRLS